tara:strand:- start:2237 stop:3106 length:870 start_codon:yes stop_codon:yes gene_type:complete
MAIGTTAAVGAGAAGAAGAGAAGAGTAGTAAAGGLFSGVSGAALATGLTTGLIGAAVPLALRGIMALTPAEREKRKADREEREAAKKAVERGEKFGFGPSRARRNKQVADEVAGFKATMAPAEEELRRKEAQLGFARAGALAPVRQKITKAYADFRGKARAAVEDRAERIAERREAAARNRLARAMGKLDQQVAERRQFALDTGLNAVSAGMQARQGKLAEAKKSTYDQSNIMANLAAIGGEEAVAAYQMGMSKYQAEQDAMNTSYMQRRRAAKAIEEAKRNAEDGTPS